MKEFHKEMLDTIIKDWNVLQIGNYIMELEERVNDLSAWIKHLKEVRRKKARKPSLDTGIRSGT